MALYEKKMKAEGLSNAAIAAFKSNFEKLVAGEDGIVRAPNTFLLAHPDSIQPCPVAYQP